MADLADRENKAMKELNANKDWLDVVSYPIATCWIYGVDGVRILVCRAIRLVIIRNHTMPPG